MTVRPATIEDAPKIVALVNSAYRGDSSRKGWTTEADLLGGQRTDIESIIEVIQTPDNVILCLFNNDQLIGTVNLQNKKSHSYLGMLTIDPQLQAGGIGSKLLQQAEEWAVQNWQATKMEMTVIQQRTELIAWYERRGYKITDRREAFPYGDERFGIPKRDDLEFIVLEKSL